MARTAENSSETTVDLLQDLCRRRDSLWRYDQYIANCDGDTELRDHWRAIKTQETRTIKTLKELLVQRVATAEF